MERTGASSVRQIMVATVVAILVATLLLVAVILPAEYGIDPLGTGATLGLLGLAQDRPVALHSDEYRLDSADLVVGPYDWVEYTYRFEEGGSMLFSWQATGPLSYNLHSAPDGAPPGYADSFDAQESEWFLCGAVHWRAWMVLGKPDGKPRGNLALYSWVL